MVVAVFESHMVFVMFVCFGYGVMFGHFVIVCCLGILEMV